MNTSTTKIYFDWPQGKTTASAHTLNLRDAADRLRRANSLSKRLLLAATPALAILVASAWALGSPETVRVMQAAIWAAGFVFLALAVDSGKKNITSLVLTGLALPTLALLSSSVAVEFSIVAAALIAGWTAFSIARR